MADRIRQFTLTAQFVRAVCKLGEQQRRRVWETLDKFARDPGSPGLNPESLRGTAAGLKSIRVDAGCRIIFSGDQTPVLIYAGSHDDAYHFAGRTTIAPQEERLLLPSSRRGAVTSETISQPTGGTPVQSAALKGLLLRTKKYLPISALLSDQPPGQQTIDLSFAQIEDLLEAKLPPAARRYSAWWANDTTSHSHATAWLAVGWRTEHLQLRAERVSFVRPAAKGIPTAET